MKAAFHIHVVVLGLTACAFEASKELTGPDLERLITGSSFRYAGELEGVFFSGQMDFHASGNLGVTTDSAIPEGGTWRLSGNSVCTRLVTLNGGEETCFTVNQTGARSFVTSHGMTVKPVH